MKRKSIKEHVGSAFGPGFASWGGGNGSGVTSGKFTGLGNVEGHSFKKLQQEHNFKWGDEVDLGSGYKAVTDHMSEDGKLVYRVFLKNPKGELFHGEELQTPQRAYKSLKTFMRLGKNGELYKVEEPSGMAASFLGTDYRRKDKNIKKESITEKELKKLVREEMDALMGNMNENVVTDEQLGRIVREEVDNVKLVKKWELTGLFKSLNLFESKLSASRFLESGMSKVIKLLQKNKLNKKQATKLMEVVIVESKPLLKEKMVPGDSGARKGIRYDLSAGWKAQLVEKPDGSAQLRTFDPKGRLVNATNHPSVSDAYRTLKSMVSMSPEDLMSNLPSV